MKRTLVAAAFVSLLASSAYAAEEPKAAAIAVAEQETVVELVSLDREKRIAVMKGPSGGTLTMNIPREAQNLDRVKPGDKFRLRYIEGLALSLNKGGAASARQVQSVSLAPKGGRPGGAVVDTKQLTTVVTAVDRNTRTIAVRGPQTQPISLKVSDEVKSFDEIAVGDTIAVVYTEAVVLEMIGEVRP
ncbi:MAG TPA: hypothetical protein VHP37_33635 [Burkholderiales bacterium]|nr:hypothetical protein [Burkholderiales bacterium]